MARRSSARLRKHSTSNSSPTKMRPTVGPGGRTSGPRSIRRLGRPGDRRQHFHSYSRGVRNHWRRRTGGTNIGTQGFRHTHGGARHGHDFSSGVQRHWGANPGGYSQHHEGYYHSHNNYGGDAIRTVSRSEYNIYSHGQYCINFGGGGAIYDCECPEHMNTCTCRSTNNDCDCAAGNNCGAVR